jgi:hypothetical protein
LSLSLHPATRTIKAATSSNRFTAVSPGAGK